MTYLVINHSLKESTSNFFVDLRGLEKKIHSIPATAHQKLNILKQK